MSDWQPIETAPKDGKPIDLWDASTKCRVADAYWHGGDKRGKWYAPNQDYDGCDGIYTDGRDPSVTHWMPLPPPPVTD